MSMGSSTSGDSGGGGGMGGGMPLGGLLGGQAGANDQAGGAAPQSNSSIANWLADPNNRKALASMVQSGGKFAEDFANAPPHLQEMARQVMGGGGGGTVNQAGGIGPSSNAMNPYGGDMAKFITPEMARGVLDSMGIPYGRIRPLV